MGVIGSERRPWGGTRVGRTQHFALAESAKAPGQTASNSTQLGPSGDKFSFFFLRKGMGGPGTTPVLGDEGEAHSLKQKKREGRFSFHSLSSSFS